MNIVNANSFPDLPPLKSEILEAWIETYTGKIFHFLDPQPEEIDIEDIAHSLANECRFGGHTRNFYSVAEHSVLVAILCSDRAALHGLLHDASEAYIRDIASPVKQYLSNYKEMEEVIQNAIFQKFGVQVTPESTKEVKEGDIMALKAEAMQLLPSQGESWLHHYPTKSEDWKQIRVHCAPPQEAKKMFLTVFNHLTGKEDLTRPRLWVPPSAEIVV